MTDAEGVRNLVGTGLIQLTGGLVTAVIALAVLFYLNWKLTVITIVILLSFGGMMALAFARLRPLFRDRGQLNADVTGRLAESPAASDRQSLVRTARKGTFSLLDRQVFANVSRRSPTSLVGAGQRSSSE